ncbi:MAG TPA: acylneuraminate cytidylyltransferase family protein [Phnomibacter sp.]|nr:acylneuraminate cytidylyltransferase family protein [Phnomibacter sp.]
MPEVLAIIPARGGSKGVPKKNSRLLDGKPLIAYAIETALASTLITHIVVNTDDEEIASIARRYTVDVLMRDAEMAQDNSPVYPVLEQSLLQAEATTGKLFDIVILLQATAPFRTGIETDTVIQQFIDHPQMEGLISVIPVEDEHPSRMYQLDDAHKMQSIWGKGETQNRQEVDPLYIRDGSYYLARREPMLTQKSIMPENKFAFVRSGQWHVNIDTEKDFMLAELLVQKWKQHIPHQ